MGPSHAGATPEEGSEAAHPENSLEAWGPITSSERLPRGHRLTRGGELRRVLARGFRFRTASLEIVWMVNEAGHPRLGLVVPKYQSNAVARNCLRRRLKEIWRRAGRPRLGAIDVVIRAKREAYDAPRSDLMAAVASWLARLDAAGR